jgi:methionyl-tRNA formyltransferase
MNSHRIVFLGTGDITLPSFEYLLEKQLVALVTQPDKPVGRKQIMTPPQIKSQAIDHDIPVFQPAKVSDESFLHQLAELKPDVIVVMAYGQILSQALLDIPKVACINLHASLLPQYRGAACIQAAIDAGDATTGITVMHVVKALDAGDVILKKECVIGKQETGGQLHDRLAELAPSALAEALELLKVGEATRTPQDPAQVSYIPKLMRGDGEIDWSMPAEALERRIRAYDPWPGTSTAFTEKKGRHQGRQRRLKIFPPVCVVDASGVPGEVLVCGDVLQIACGDGALEISKLQPDGSRRMSASDFLLSEPVDIGDLLVSG